ncbi:hypothetical protein MJI37_31050, partial [Salmonella enterica subsp. enterica serovar Cerro]|nr:hypothetical protein [Salmonella enterica subsp. enterica serovar Cerro]
YWDGRRHPMRLRKESGIWELFIPGAHNGQLYKFELLDANGNLHNADKTDRNHQNSADGKATTTRIDRGHVHLFHEELRQETACNA